MTTAQTPDENAIPRRSFLKVGFIGGAVLALGSGVLLATRSGKTEPAAPGPLRAIEPQFFPVLVAAVQCVLPFAEDPVALAMEVDDSLSYAGPSAKDINLVLGLLENGLAGVLVRGGSTPFTLCSADERTAVLLRWRESSLELMNMAYHGLRKVIYGTYYGNRERAKSIGYPGPIWEKPDPGPIQARAPLSPPFVPSEKSE